MPLDDGGGRSVPPAAPKNEGKAQVVRLGEIVLIHDLKRQGLSVSAIARQLGLDRKTVRRLRAPR
jgi:plasmid maintenance system antidote protein VapI